MKKGISVLLALILCLGCFTGCVGSIDNSAYVPTGDALLMEGEDPAEETIAPDSQDLTLAYYPDRSMNPLYGSDYTNRVVMSLMYQGLFAVDSKNNTTPILCSQYQVTPDNRTWTIYLEPNATFSDGTLRTFLTYGIDRQTLVDDNYGGLALPTTLPISPMSPYYSKSLATNYDYDEMRFIDAASKFRVPTNDKGVPRTLQLLVNSDDSARLRCARNIAATLTELGLACETVESPTSVYEARLQAANYDIYLGITKLPTTADLSEFYRPWGEMSWGGLANETIYNMVNQSLADRGNYYNLHKLVADDGRIIPVMAGYYAIYAKRGVLSDLNPARDNVFYYTLGKTMESSKVATQFS